jgi:phage gp45-like
MMEFLERLGAILTRGKVTSSQIAGRTIVGLSGLAGEQFANVELLLPPGYVASPVRGSDVVVLQVNGSRDHKIVLGGDNTADAIALAPGEIGLSRGGQTVILRTTGIEITTPLPITIQAEDLNITCTGNLSIDAPQVALTGVLAVTGLITVNGVTVQVP